VEECGPEIVSKMPHLVELQYRVLEIDCMKEFIRGSNYFPIGGEEYTQQVAMVLGRN
jgi:hypothetical protein